MDDSLPNEDSLELELLPLIDDDSDGSETDENEPLKLEPLSESEPLREADSLSLIEDHDFSEPKSGIVSRPNELLVGLELLAGPVGESQTTEALADAS